MPVHTPPQESAPLVARTVEIPDPGDLLQFLPSAHPGEALAWIRHGHGIIGIGEAVRITTTGTDRFRDADTAFTTLASHTIIRDEVERPGTGLVAFGSFAFSSGSLSGGALIIPKVIVGRNHETSWLTVITRAGPSPAPDPAELLTQVTDLRPDVRVDFEPGTRDRDQWLTSVHDVMARIRGGEAAKVVLARDLIARLSGPADARRVLRRLSEAYSTCWSFAVDGLFGATPELLARKHRGLISSRVLAGTIQRSADNHTNAARAAAFVQDSKELSEHAYAVDSLVDSLRTFAASFSVPEAPFILHLPNVMHLATDVTAVPDRQAQHMSSLAVAERFHPTAAVCGTPTLSAAGLIQDYEGLDRHRYAGPVGWLGADGDGEWGIALRSGLALSPQTWQLFAGCGIMTDSRPESEWDETEAKFAPMKQALTGGSTIPPWSRSG